MARRRRALPPRRPGTLSESRRASAFTSARRSPMSIRSAKPWSALLSWCARCETKVIDIRYVDAGGGLGISYDETELAREFSSQARHYAKAVLRSAEAARGASAAGAGRAIVGPAGVLLTRVVYRKRNDGKHFVVVDAAMNDLLRPSLYACLSRNCAGGSTSPGRRQWRQSMSSGRCARPAISLRATV